MLKPFSIFVGLTQVLMTITVFTFIPVMMVIRYFNAYKANLTLKEKLLVTLTPFSISYYLMIKEELRFKFYNKILISYTVITIVGMTFTFFKDIV